MSAPLLTVDLGNSRCKLRAWRIDLDGPRLLRGTDLASDAALAAALGAWLDVAERPRHAALSAVGARELELALRERLQASIDGEVVTPPHGLELDVREAHTVGLDRLFAARGALELIGGPALVVDAGTAMTVDALDRSADGRGRFRGGAIAPGPELCAEALERRGARLLRIEPRPGVPALGRSTPEALASGVVHGFRGAARELVRAVGEASGLSAAPLVLTGGARGFLLEPPLFEDRDVRVEPDLVHAGLLVALRAHLDARGAARSEA